MTSRFWRRLVLAVAAAAALLALAAEARAEYPVEDRYEERYTTGAGVFDRSYWVARFGMAVGSIDVADLAGVGVGAHLSLSRVFGKVGLKADYDLLHVAEEYVDRPRAGLLHRAGLGVRWNAAHALRSRKGQITMWLEGGAGRQWFAWDKGGTLTRNDVSIGIGADIIGNFADWGERPRLLGFSYALRFLIAENPYADLQSVEVCGGPCDTPTVAPRFDASFMFVMEIEYGR